PVPYDLGQVRLQLYGEDVAVALGLQEHRVVDVPDGLFEGEGGQLQLALPRVEAGEGEQVLDDVGHAVGLVEDDPQEVRLHVRRDLPRPVGQGLGIAADIGEGRAQFVGDVGHEFPAHLLRLVLLGDVVDHHHHAA